MTTYWTPKTEITAANLNAFVPTIDVDSQPQGLVALVSTGGSVITTGEDSEAGPVNVLQTPVLQYNGHFWRIGINLNQESTFNKIFFLININDELVVGTMPNKGQGTIEYILDPAKAASFATPLLPGGSCTISWNTSVLDVAASSTIKGGVDSPTYLFVQDIGIM